MTHTKGPWKQGVNYPERIIVDHQVIAYVGQWQDGLIDKEEEANAKLIAAAPELLEACRGVVSEILTTPAELTDALIGIILIKLNMVIAKAEGGK